MALSDDRIFEIAEAYGTLDSEYRRAEFARAIEAEVRKQDTALIRQLVEALDGVHPGEHQGGVDEAIAAGRARLQSKSITSADL